MASFSLVPTYVKDEDALSKCEEDSVKCERRTLILSHRKTPTREFGASHFLPLLPFLYLHSCESQQGWRQQRDEHVWAPPQCSRELYPHPQPQVEGASPTENCPVHCMLFCPCCTLLQALCTYFLQEIGDLFLLQFSMYLCTGKFHSIQPSLVVVFLVLSFHCL